MVDIRLGGPRPMGGGARAAFLYHGRKRRLENNRQSALEAAFGSPTDMGSTGTITTILATEVTLPVDAYVFLQADADITSNNQLRVGFDTLTYGQFYQIPVTDAGNRVSLGFKKAGTVIRLASGGGSTPAMSVRVIAQVTRPWDIGLGTFT